MASPTTARSARRALLIGLAGLVLGATLMPGSGSAHPPPARDWYSHRYPVRLEDASGHPLPVYHHEGQTFVMGRFGDRYRIVVENPTPQRVEAVVSVDGRDAISGSRGDYTRQRGYIIAPYGSVVIDGFRQSLSDVAAFRFTTPEDSYSARMGTIEHTGVIGVAIFPEAQPRPSPAPRPFQPTEPYRPRPRGSQGDAEKSEAPAARGRSSSRAAPSEYGWDDRAPEGRLGTEYGETRWSPVREVTFRRRNASTPDSLVTLRYDDRRGLIARGIDVGGWEYERPYWSRWAPDPFPDSRFAPPPP